ncbi:poly(A) polymerase [Pancytospora philotis]|nr:poly(A) polymerase [Pancytospora philotis]
MDNTCEPKYTAGGVVSTKESEPQANKLSLDLCDFLYASGFYESEESAQTRERVLGWLDYMVKQFVAGVPGSPDRPGGKIFTFGSYRLGVHDRGADIDTLCVVPRHVARSDFFTVFYEQLRSNAAVADLTKVEDSYVPLIKMSFHGIPIDLTFARLSLPVIRDSISLLGDSILRAMDEKCIVSLNGSRVTDAILSLVPRTDAFHAALRAVKLWAKRRRIYGAAYGFFGGVAFAICVARVCQMHPRACAYDVLARFFEHFSTWKWPAPVLLRPVADLNYHLKVWDPKTYPTDKYHKMPVITPAYPAMCSTHNVTQSTAVHITAELVRGHEIMRSGDFTQLFEGADFFKKYKLFLEISITAADQADFLAWSGFTESKIRVLCMKIEGVKDVTAALPFPRCFKDIPEEEPRVAASVDASPALVPVQLADDAAPDCTSAEAEPETKRMKPNRENEPSATKCTDAAAEDCTETKDGLSGFEIKDKPEQRYAARWFVAINAQITKSAGNKLYIDGPIKDFLGFMNAWEKKTDGMSISIAPRKKREVQEVVKAAPCSK